MTDIPLKIKNQLSSSKSIICDDVNSLGYKEIENSIECDEFAKHSFDAIAVQNKLQEAMQIITQLVNKQNFLVLNGALEVNHAIEHVPSFCERLISFQDSNKITLSRISTASASQVENHDSEHGIIGSILKILLGFKDIWYNESPKICTS